MSDYCPPCDTEVDEPAENFAGEEVCPGCEGRLYDDFEDYRDRLVDFLTQRVERLSEDEVDDFIERHDNPGQGDALAIIDFGEAP